MSTQFGTSGQVPTYSLNVFDFQFELDVLIILIHMLLEFWQRQSIN